MAGGRYLAFEDGEGESFVLADGLAADKFVDAPYAPVQAFWAPPILRRAFLENGGDTEALRQFLADMAGQAVDIFGAWVEDREVVEWVVQEIDQGHVARLVLYRRTPTGRVWGDAMLPHPPPPPPPPPTHEQTTTTTTCVVISIGAHCGHNRKIEGGKTLEVVPDKSLGSDTIGLEDKIDHGHGSDPQWAISEGSLQGMSFKATGPTTSKLWIPSVSPRRYVVTCKTCSGSSQSLTIAAYPSNAFKIEVDLDKLLKVVHKITDWIKKLLKIVTERFELEFGHIKSSLEGKWKEHTDARAFYNYKLSVEGELVKAAFKMLFGPSKITEFAKKIPGVGKYIGKVIDWLIKAGLFLKIEGAISISANFERKSPDQPRFVKNLGGGPEGSVSLSVGVEGSVFHDEIIQVELSAKGTIKVAGEIEIEDEGMVLTPKVDFDGLKGLASVKILKGWITFEETIVLVDPEPLYKGDKHVLFGDEEEKGGT